MRYSAYKEVVIQIDAIFETINLNLSIRKQTDIENLTARLRNQINRFFSTMSVNAIFIFPKISNTQDALDIRHGLQKILELTEDYYLNVKAANRNTVLEEIHALNWHNGITLSLMQLTVNSGDTDPSFR